MRQAYYLFRLLFYPIIRFILPLFSTGIKKRLIFEKENINTKQEGFAADYGFEVSSEGELEQVLPLLNHFLSNHAKVELIYCSPSVKHKVNELQSEFPTQLKTMALPIVSYHPYLEEYNPELWLSAKTFFLCRYDFFPELIFYGSKNNVEFVLLSGMAKTYKSKNWITQSYLKYCYKKFNLIIAASASEEENFKQVLNNNHNIKDFDFRVVQILSRLEKREENLNFKWNLYPTFKQFITKFDKKKRVILGSFWHNEIDLFSRVNIDHTQLITLVPHVLTDQSINEITRGLKEKDQRSYVISHSTTENELQKMMDEYVISGGVWIIALKGILCELYSDFNHAYVGGGFNESIHSVLEPYLAGAKVFCGPRVHRSTEFDYIKHSAPERVLTNKSQAELGKQIFDFEPKEEIEFDFLKLNNNLNKQYNEIIEILS